MRKNSRGPVLTGLLFLAFVLMPQSVPAATGIVRPRLIVTLVIDQFRADYLTRFEKRFLPARKGAEVGGFGYLMNQGAYFPFAEYDILQSMTCPGHATVLTGSYPYQAGVPINMWFNPNRMEMVYCAEDPASPIVGAPFTDPHVGTSPRNLIATTVGDELKNAGLPSRVVSLAVKDRAAIMMGGHRADIAVWMDNATHHWVSSQYYLPDGKLPAWVDELNAQLAKREGTTVKWEPKGEGTGYSDEASIGDKNRTFPHEDKFLSRGSLAGPLGIELTGDAVEKAIDAYSLGKGKATDLLAVSFSSHDYAGHKYGPNSREMEEMTVTEDRVISRILNHVRKKLGGLDGVVIVLTGDHGVAPVPEWAAAHKLDAGKINEDELAKLVTQRLEVKWGKLKNDAKWVGFSHDFNIFLNRPAIAEKELKLAEVEAEAKAAVLGVPGVAYVITSADYEARKLPPGMHERQILHTYFPGRSGDLVTIPKPYYIYDEDTATHTTGYAYDRTVPLAIAGAGIQPGTYATPAHVIDIAPTLAFLSGVVAPSLSEGRVLSEALAGTGARGSRAK